MGPVSPTLFPCEKSKLIFNIISQQKYGCKGAKAVSDACKSAGLRNENIDGEGDVRFSSLEFIVEKICQSLGIIHCIGIRVNETIICLFLCSCDSTCSSYFGKRRGIY